MDLRLGREKQALGGRWKESILFQALSRLRAVVIFLWNSGAGTLCLCFSAILGLQPRDKAAMLVVNTKEIFRQSLHQNRVHFPVERNAFVFDPQNGRHDIISNQQ